MSEVKNETSAPKAAGNNVEVVKAELASLQKSVEILTASNVDIPSLLLERIGKLQKSLAGNNSQQTADKLNELKPLLNKNTNAQFAEYLAKLAGATGVKVLLKATPVMVNGKHATHTIKNKEGVETTHPAYEITFEAAGSGTTGTGHASTGGTKAPAKFNSFTIEANEDAQAKYGYADSKTFDVGNQALKYTLNPKGLNVVDGKVVNADGTPYTEALNPGNRAVTYGAAASAPAILQTIANAKWEGVTVILENKEVAPETAETVAPATV